MREVVVAGVGVAAAAAACSLLRSGFRPLLLRVGRPTRAGVEALPPEARAQIEALGWSEVLTRAGALAVDGFENCLDEAHPILKPGPFYHVDRAALAEAALRAAVDRGAAVVACPRLPSLREEGGEVSLIPSGRRFFAAIDATGRAAAWSRPRRRRGRQVADSFRIWSGPDPVRGRIVAGPYGWAYRIGVPGFATIGVISSGRPPTRSLHPALAEQFGPFRKTPIFQGRWPAFPQWAAEPASGRRLAVGDAAFACDPLAGQGIRFALASALAAASVIATLDDPDRAETARRFYDEFVASARARHLQHLDGLPDQADGPSGRDPHPSRRAGVGGSLAPGPPGSGRYPPGPGQLPSRVRFAGLVRSTGLNVGGSIVPGVAVELPDGGLVRWLGSFDLLDLAALASSPIPPGALMARLLDLGLDAPGAEVLLRWCLQHGILAGCGEP